jgi:hypothetical protein
MSAQKGAAVRQVSWLESIPGDCSPGDAPLAAALRSSFAFPLSAVAFPIHAMHRAGGLAPHASRTGQTLSYSAWGRSGLSPASQLSLSAPYLPKL